MTQHGTVAESSDGGITWTRRDLNPAPDFPNGIVYVVGRGGGHWVSTGSFIGTPYDWRAGAPAQHWVKASGVGGGGFVSDIEYAEDLDLFVGSDFTIGSTDENAMAYSEDGGATWIETTSAFDFNQNTAWGLAYSEDLGLFVVLGICRDNSDVPLAHQALTSTDGITWTDQGELLTDQGISIGQASANCRGGLMWISRLGLFVFVASGALPDFDPTAPNAATSPDGLTWTPTGQIYSTRFGDNGIIPEADADAAWVDMDDDGVGLTMVTVMSIGEFDLSFLPFGSLWSSPDGATWTEISLGGFPDSFSPIGIAYGDGTWVCVGSVTPLSDFPTIGIVYTSTDGGATWTERTFPSDFQLPTDVKYQDGVFVAAGQTPTAPPVAPTGWNVGRIALP